MVDCTTNSYAHHRPIPPWTARTGRRDIARGRIYSRLGRGPGGVTDLHAARPTRGAHHCREVPRKDDTTATFSLQLERAKWAEIFFRLMHGILNMGLAVATLRVQHSTLYSPARSPPARPDEEFYAPVFPKFY
jgi:hypothetical protein